MKSELKQSWVATLRSGNYKQGAGQLRGADNRCCCLGVLCDITNPEKWTPHPCGAWEMDGFSGVPSRRRLDEWGIRASDADILVKKNDSGLSFKSIANWIEKNIDD